MARFDVYRLRTGDIALDCQSDQLSHLSTRLIVPLARPEDIPVRMERIHPIFEVAGEPMVMVTHLAGAVPSSALKHPFASLASEDYRIQRALDALTGTA